MARINQFGCKFSRNSLTRNNSNLAPSMLTHISIRGNFFAFVSRLRMCPYDQILDPTFRQSLLHRLRPSLILRKREAQRSI